MRRSMFGLVVVALLACNLQASWQYAPVEIIGTDTSLQGWPTYIERGQERSLLRKGEKLTIIPTDDQSIMVTTKIESSGWDHHRVKPKKRLVIKPSTLLARKPESSAALLMGLASIRQKSIILNWPPVSSPWHLPPGVSMLTGYLQSLGHEVVQRYGHIDALDQAMLKYGGSAAAWALDVARSDEKDILVLYRARMILEQVSGLIPARDDSFSIERNSVNYTSPYRDGTIEGVLRAVKNREQHIFYGWCASEVKLAEGYKPDIYGISVADERQLLTACILASMAKDALPGTLVVLGGNFWSQVWPYTRPEFSRMSEICDCVSYGEGFVPMKLLAENGSPSRVPNIVWFDGESVVINERNKQPVSFESLPLPVFLDEPQQWLPERVLPLYCTSNCPGCCGFCAISAGSDTFRKRPRCMSARKIARMMEALRCRYFDISDETFSIERQLAIGEALRSLGYEANWLCLTGIDNRLIDPDLCERLYLAGARNFQMGLESLNRDTLREERKGQNRPENYGQILRNLTEAGIQPHVFELIGDPREPLHYGLQWIGFNHEYGEHILTGKTGRWRLVRMSPDGRDPRHLPIVMEDDNTPLHPNLNFQYGSGSLSRKRVEALVDVSEAVWRRHWAFEVTSTIHWGGRISWTMNDFRKAAAKLEPIHHLGGAFAKVSGAVSEELGRKVEVASVDDAIRFCAEHRQI